MKTFIYLIKTGMGLNFSSESKSEIPADIKKSETHSFIPPIKSGRVIQIYDLNTLVIAVKIPEFSDKIYRFTMDIQGIRVPSTRAQNPDEKHFAKEAKDYLSSLCLRENVTLENLSHDGERLKADIYCGFLSLGEWLCHMGYAVTEDEDYPNNWYKHRINTLSM